MFRPPEQEVFISVTFTWDVSEGERLRRAWKDFYRDVYLGGPAFGNVGDKFIPGIFLKKGVTITSRGCPWACEWCFVPEREGKVKILPIAEGWIVQDNNLLACPQPHIESVFEMLRKQRRGISFNGGLDTRLLQKWHIDLLKSIKIEEIWTACDSAERIYDLERAADYLSDFREDMKRCYVMIGFEELLFDAEKRLERVYDLGFLPFSQLYRPKSYDKKIWSLEWRNLNRKWSRPAAYRKRQED